MNGELTNLNVLPYVVTWPGRSEHPLVLSLLDTHAPNAAAIASIPNGPYNRISGVTGFTSFDSLVDIGFVNTVSVRVRATSDVKYWREEILWACTVQNPLYGTAVRSAIKSVTWAVGFRLAIVCWALRGDLTATDPKGIASSVHAQNAASHFDAQLLGADAESLAAFLPFLHEAGGEFSMSAYTKLQNVEKTLIAYFNDSTRQPTLTRASAS